MYTFRKALVERNVESPGKINKRTDENHWTTKEHTKAIFYISWCV